MAHMRGSMGMRERVCGADMRAADMRGVEMRRARMGSAEMRRTCVASANVRHGGRMSAAARGMTAPCGRSGRFGQAGSGSDEKRQGDDARARC